ncbi:MAG: hypothetical protein AAGC78_18585 [Cellvibrio sp.]|uniref:hypothetical protein n=1 Tax=Cellvibrio sp. TaxID=1965322 RepID=UPI0031A5E010
MKLNKIVLATGLSLLSCIAVNTSAQTTVPSGCTWTYVSNQSGPTGTILNTACKVGSTTLATREQKYNQHSPASCSITWVAPGYTVSGSCDSAQILQYVTTQTAAQQCYTGSTTVYQPGPFTPPFNVAQFCGQNCPYSVQPLANYSYPPLRYTCL